MARVFAIVSPSLLFMKGVVVISVSGALQEAPNTLHFSLILIRIFHPANSLVITSNQWLILLRKI